MKENNLITSINGIACLFVNDIPISGPERCIEYLQYSKQYIYCNAQFTLFLTGILVCSLTLRLTERLTERITYSLYPKSYSSMSI